MSAPPLRSLSRATPRPTVGATARRDCSLDGQVATFRRSHTPAPSMGRRSGQAPQALTRQTETLTPTFARRDSRPGRAQVCGNGGRNGTPTFPERTETGRMAGLGLGNFGVVGVRGFGIVGVQGFRASTYPSLPQGSHWKGSARADRQFESLSTNSGSSPGSTRAGRTEVRGHRWWAIAANSNDQAARRNSAL